MKKDIIGYEGDYEIYSDGRVFSIKSNKFLKLSPNKDVEYLQVNLWKNNTNTWFYVHRLVAIHFIANPLNLPEVNHIDGNRQNNLKQNLEWVTRKGNIEHAINTRLRIYSNRISEEEFIECLEAVINGESYKDLSLRVPYKVPFLSTKVRKLAKVLGLEDYLDQSLKKQRADRNKKVLKIINARKSNDYPEKE